MIAMKHVLGALALTAMSAAPALAQPVINDPGRCEAEFPNANCQNLGPGNPYTGTGPTLERRGDVNRSRHWRASRAHARRSDNDFAPAEAAGDVVGDAVGAAGAIATAPFRPVGAWDSGWGNSGWDNSYAMMGGGAGWGNGDESNVGTYTAGNVAGNWVACPRGAMVQGVDGRMHRCR
ncbi:conserved protein of unknown function [Bradyrhizobium sp. ORS 285]|uniref:hypothetical protein n=1 Tax=Bradyrhizobium sp. ORS 285 TaxID=115808 RepID=UPI000240A07E|nr:hypothetical protein [Bradyrhizobium sp. ORS 285]CCD88204.1 conserved hypothetical protein [Bradyrhizobium sp. ORS 285]SMX59896.1 conserved protein of unknown function [Bradyrhizobium sp. ORS 285]